MQEAGQETCSLLRYIIRRYIKADSTEFGYRSSHDFGLRIEEAGYMRLLAVLAGMAEGEEQRAKYYILADLRDG